MPHPIIITLRVPVETRKQSGEFVATCEFLNVTGRAGSIDEALTALTELLTKQLSSCFELCAFDQIFRRKGYSALNSKSQPGAGRYIDVRVTLWPPQHVVQGATHPVTMKQSLEPCAA